MNIHQWESQSRRSRTLPRLMVSVFLLAGSLSMPEYTFAQTVCTLVVNYTGQLWHGQVGVPASFLEFERVGGPCLQSTESVSGTRYTTDIDGRYSWTSIQLYSPKPYETGYGDHIVFYIQPRRQPALCELVLSWDGYIMEEGHVCTPADLQTEEFRLPRLDVDKTVGPPILPMPEVLYEPYYYEPVNSYVFSWSAVPKANRYILRIDTALGPFENARAWKHILRSTPEALVEEIPEEFTWRVRALNGCSLSAWSTPTIYASVDDSESDLPEVFKLSQNYPNPFNSATVIRFDLDVVSDWSLTIYNILGQTVRRYSGSESEGQQLIEWYGDDGIGNPMPSGMYFYRVETSRWTDSRKMILLR